MISTSRLVRVIMRKFLLSKSTARDLARITENVLSKSETYPQYSNTTERIESAGKRKINPEHLSKEAGDVATRLLQKSVCIRDLLAASMNILGINYSDLVSELYGLGSSVNISVPGNMITESLKKVIVGRNVQIQQLASIVLSKQNVIVTGKKGCGKTSVVYGLCKLIALNRLPQLSNYLFMDLKSSVPNEPTMYRVDGSIAGDISQSISHVSNLFPKNLSHVNVIGYLDNPTDNGLAIANSATGNQFIIVVDEDRLRYLEQNCKFLVRSAKRLYIKEPSREDVELILEAQKTSLEFKYQCTISSDIIKYCVSIADRFHHSSAQPLKSMDILENTCARMRVVINDNEDTHTIDINKMIETRNWKQIQEVASSLSKPQIYDILKPDKPITLKKSDIAVTMKSVAQLSDRASVDAITGDTVKLLGSLEEHLQKFVYGQNDAVSEVCSGIRRKSLGLGDPQKPDSYLFIGSTGVGKCVDSCTFIRYNNGIKRIGRFKKGTAMQTDSTVSIDVLVESFNETYKTLQTKATKLYYGGLKAGLELNMKHGYQLKCSYAHPIISYSNRTNNYGFTPAKELRRGDYIAVRYDYHPIGEDIPIKEIAGIEIDAEVAYFLGILTGDGHVHNKHVPDKFELSSIDAEIIESFVTIAAHRFGQQTHKAKRGCQYNIRSKELATIIDELDMRHLSYDKYIPDIVIESRGSVLRAFLQGLFDADGTSNKQGYVSYSSSSERLARDVQNVLLVFGIRSTIRKKPTYRRPSWNLNIQSDADKFYDRIGFRLSRKQARRVFLPKSKNANFQFYPPVVAKLMHELVLNRKDRDISTHKSISNKWSAWTLGKRVPSREKLLQFINELKVPENHELRKFSDSEVMWLQIDSIKKVIVDHYDLVVPSTHTFLANGVMSHNTFLAKNIAEIMFGTQDALVYIDMSEMMEQHSVSKLIGSPPGYVGYNEGGQLTEKVYNRPYCVILFDEIEKAHPQVLNILLQVLQEGRLTDSAKKEVDFSHAIIIMTSNLGTDISITSIGFGGDKKKDKADATRKEVNDYLRPELRNRLNSIVYFKPLDEESVKKIIRYELSLAKTRTSYDIMFDESIVEHIIDISKENPRVDAYGAREVKRIIDSDIYNIVADEIVKRKISADTSLNVSIINNKVKVAEVKAKRRIEENEKGRQHTVKG